MTDIHSLTDGPVGRTIARLALPLVGGYLVWVGFIFADTWFVSRLGTDELAALAFTIPAYIFIESVFFGIGIGAASVVARLLGRGDRTRTVRVVTDALLLAFLVALVMTVAGILTIDPVFRFLGADERTLPHVRRYMTIFYLAAPFTGVRMAGNGALLALGDARYSSIALVGAAVANFLLDPILIFGFGPIPALGLAGAAWASMGGRIVQLTLTVGRLARRHGVVALHRPRIGEVLDSWRAILVVTLPNTATQVLGPVASGWITRIVAGFGTAAVAGMGTGQRIDSFTMLVFWSLGNVLTPFAGQNAAAGRSDRLARAVRLAFGFALALGVISAGILALAAPAIGRIFSTDPAVAGAIARYLRIIPADYGFFGMFLMASAVFNGMGLPVRAAALDAIRMFAITVPLAWLGGRFFGFTGALLGISLGGILAGTISFLWVRHTIREARRGVAVNAALIADTGN